MLVPTKSENKYPPMFYTRSAYVKNKNTLDCLITCNFKAVNLTCMLFDKEPPTPTSTPVRKKNAQKPPNTAHK